MMGPKRGTMAVACRWSDKARRSSCLSQQWWEGGDEKGRKRRELEGDQMQERNKTV